MSFCTVLEDAWFEPAGEGVRMFVAVSPGALKLEDRNSFTILGTTFNLNYLMPMRGYAVFEAVPAAPDGLFRPEPECLLQLAGPSRGVVKLGS